MSKIRRICFRHQLSMCKIEEFDKIGLQMFSIKLLHVNMKYNELLFEVKEKLI